ncbi:MAG: hypothetical protein AB7G88_13610, partial [Thermomicrobiales bacterium]
VDVGAVVGVRVAVGDGVKVGSAVAVAAGDGDDVPLAVAEGVDVGAVVGWAVPVYGGCGEALELPAAADIAGEAASEIRLGDAGAAGVPGNALDEIAVAVGVDAVRGVDSTTPTTADPFGSTSGGPIGLAAVSGEASGSGDRRISPLTGDATGDEAPICIVEAVGRPSGKRITPRLLPPSPI